MSDLARLLIDDIERRENAFIAKLYKSGSPELAEDYLRIQDLRKALDAVRVDPVKPGRRGVNRSTSVHSEPLPDGFVLMKEVRYAIKTINKHRFRSSDVFDALTARFPGYITEDKKGTISATLSNLVAKQELASERDGQRKVWYTVLALRGHDSEVQHDLLDAE